MPDTSYVTKEGLDRVDARLTAELKETNRNVEKNSAAIVKLETLYGTLVKLPDAIASLEKTVIDVNYNLETMSTRMNQINESVREQKESIQELKAENRKQSETINKVDNKSKLDWASFVTGNFWNLIFKLIVLIAAIFVAYNSIVGA